MLPNTIMPVVAGCFVAWAGPIRCAIIATGLIFLGQVFNLFSAIYGMKYGMMLGLWIFGAGYSPMSVIQETLIVNVFGEADRGLALAVGLSMGKIASFISAFTTVSFAKASSIGICGPFLLSSIFSGISFVLAISLYRCMRFPEPQTQESNILNIKHPFKTLDSFSNPIWWYFSICYSAGTIWPSFIKL